MLSIQHILHSLYTYDMTYLHRYGASVVYPDAIRAYTNGSRKYSHFEHVFRDKYYYMVFPDLNTEVMIQLDLQFATAKVIQRLLKRKAD